MGLIERYVLRRTALAFAGTLLPLLGIVWVTQALARINLVTDSGQSALAFMTLATLILPSVVPLVLPFALVIGITQTLSSMNSDSELTVLNAAGSSPATIIRPLVFLGLALSLLSFLTDNVIEPFSRTEVRRMIATAHADLLASVVQENTFRQITDGLYVQIGSRRSGGLLHGIFVADSRHPGQEFVYYAREGAIDETGSALIMKDGEVHRKLPQGNVSIIKFDSYAFDLTDMTEAASETRIQAKDRDLLYLLHPDADDPAFKKKPSTFKAEVHRRFTEWTFPLVFTLIALAIAVDARSHREARLHSTIAAMFLCLLIRWAYFYAANSAEDTPWLTLAMYGIPLESAILASYRLSEKRL